MSEVVQILVKELQQLSSSSLLSAHTAGDELLEQESAHPAMETRWEFSSLPLLVTVECRILGRWLLVWHPVLLFLSSYTWLRSSIFDKLLRVFCSVLVLAGIIRKLELIFFIAACMGLLSGFVSK